jgi:hypothetical protein
MNYEEFSAQQNEKMTAVLTMLDSESFDKESVKSTFSSILKAQDDYGKASYTKKAGQVSKYLEVLGKLGYDKDSYENPDEFVAKFNDKTQSLETKSSEYQLLEARLRRIEGEKQAETERAESLKLTAEKSTLEQKLTQALDAELKGTKYIVKDLISDKKVKLVDGEVVFVEGDEVVLFDDGIKQLIADNEDLVKVGIKSGAGSTSRVLNSAPSGSLSMAAINKMSPEQIKLHMAEIKKLAGMR